MLLELLLALTAYDKSLACLSLQTVVCKDPKKEYGADPAPQQMSFPTLIKVAYKKNIFT